MRKENKSNELYISRLYDAPVEVVWEAWTDPDQVAKWWGPRGFTITTHSKDLKVGGHWNYTMHGPDGTDYPNITTYHEVEKFKRLVYDHGANDKQPPLFRVTVSFQSIGKKTQMDMTMTLATPEEAARTKKFIKDAGGNSTWDRLAEFLKKKNTGKEVFVINRSFDAPIETLFEMWTDAAHISQWLGPAGTKMEYLNDEIAEGKTAFYKMSFDSGVTMYGKMTYAKIERPNYIEYTQNFTDENGGLSKHPLAPLFPDYMLTRVYFTKEAEQQTRLTIIWEPTGDYSAEELEAFVEMRAGMTQGWSQSFDKLENLQFNSGTN